MTSLLNEIAAAPGTIDLVLDDYHVIESGTVDVAVDFLLEHLPPRMHLTIATREDPHLPLARMRAMGQLSELRAADLRFAPAEADEFLNGAMGLKLTAENISALETRTEGWIVGLQLAAISMRGRNDPASFIDSFTGNHGFVLDYLVEEVLQRQPESVQTFLLRTSILDRLSGPLCDAVLRAKPASGQGTLEYLERANLFIAPLDNDRRWYRYHHLFAEFLRHRLQQGALSPKGDISGICSDGAEPAELHRRASAWYEANGLDIEAFHHAAIANDVDNAARIMEGKGMPLHFRGAVAPVLKWLESLPKAVLDGRPSLWVMFASATSMTGRLDGVEERLKAAEAALQGVREDAKSRNLIGHIAAIRALLAAGRYDAEAIIAQSSRALEYLHPDNLSVRTATTWKMGIAYQFRGDRAAAARAYAEAIATSKASGNAIVGLSAAIGLGNVQESENQLRSAAETYGQVLGQVGEIPMPAVSEAYLGLARIHYERDDLETARRHWERGVELSRHVESAGRSIPYELFRARLALAAGDSAGALAVLNKAAGMARDHDIAYQMPDIVAAQVRVLLFSGDLQAAEEAARSGEFPQCMARLLMAQGQHSAALELLESLRRQAEAKRWADERFKVMQLQAMTLNALGKRDKALRVLDEALASVESEGFVRSFVDEGPPMAALLSDAVSRGSGQGLASQLLAAFRKQKFDGNSPPPQSLFEPLSERETEVLSLIAQGLSNQEICERLFLALSTVKGHNQKIFDKLHVQRRTEAVAKAREMGLV